MASRKKRVQRKSITQSPAARDVMLSKPPKTARQVVYRVLTHWQDTGEFFAENLQSLSLKAELSPLDRRLAREMVAGIIRRQATLDALIGPHVKRPRENVEDPLWRLLRMGTYELAFLSSIPPHASVNETTELARFLRRPHWTGFLNGTLRSLSRALLDDDSSPPAADAFPLANGRYRKCAGAWFPDPQVEPVGYFARAFSFPVWLAERWQRQLSARGGNALSPLPWGERARVRGTNEAHAIVQATAGQASRDNQDPLPPSLEELGFWFNSPPPLILRVNRLKVSREEVLETFQKENIPAEAGELADAIVLKQSQNVTELPGFALGHFSVQDLTAMKAVELLAAQPGEAVWDVCAAPGTKTAAMAEAMQNEGRVLATDIHPARLKLIEDNRARLSLQIIEVQSISANGEDLPEGSFDAALVDVPCSNTGVLGKRAEARWRIAPSDLEELPRIQHRLLEAACRRVKPGGRVVYSTCSLEPEENEAVVAAFLRNHSDWQLVEQQFHWPGQPADGGFAALLRHVPQAQ